MIGGRLAAVLVLHDDVPEAAAPFGRDAAGPRQDGGAQLRRRHGVQHDKAGILDPAIGILEAAGELGFQRPAGHVKRERRRARDDQWRAQAIPGAPHVALRAGLAYVTETARKEPDPGEVGRV